LRGLGRLLIAPFRPDGGTFTEPSLEDLPMERWITDPLNDTFHFSGSSQRYASRRDSDLLKEMSLLIRSRYGLVHLATDEDERVEVLLKHLADSMNLPLFFWIPSAGLSRSGLPNSIAKTEDPDKALHHVEVSRLAAIYCMEGLAPFLRDDALLEARLLRVVRQFSQKDGALVLTGGDLSLPEAVKPYAAPMRLPAPERKDYSDLIKHIYRDVSAQMPVRVELGKDDMNRLLNNLRGLTLLEADKLLTKAIIETASWTWATSSRWSWPSGPSWSGTGFWSIFPWRKI